MGFSAQLEKPDPLTAEFQAKSPDFCQWINKRKLPAGKQTSGDRLPSVSRGARDI